MNHLKLCLIGRALALSALAGCSDGGDGTGAAAATYTLSSVVFSPESSSTYISLLDSLDVPDVDFGKARELLGTADIWWHEGSLFVSDGTALTITKYALKDGQLVAGDQVSFADYGLTSLGFWLNTFVARDKAYLVSSTAEYVIWNPDTMEITGSVPLPSLAARQGLKPFAAYADRAAVLRDGRLYLPLYYTDETFFQFDAGSSIVVLDTVSDEVVDIIEAPCPGLDFATRDERGNVYFSSWIFAPGGATVLEQPATCVVELAAGEDSVSKLFDVADVTEGQQGGALRYLGDGKALISVLHGERSESDDPAVVAYGPNWRFWLYDLAEGAATELSDIDWNAGAACDAVIAGEPHLLVPAGDYTSTQLYRLGADGSATARLQSKGWSLRLFDVTR